MLCGFSFWDRNEQLFVGTLSSSITTNSLGLFFRTNQREPRGVYSTPTVLRVSHALDVNLPNLNVSEQVGADLVCRDEYFR
ncbi:Uncharacterised protein [Vibrio cholerae]|nr:Uncharacterised protein [Vibrio cholerae]